MKKSLRQITFGLSIIAASVGVTSAMEPTALESGSVTTSAEQAAWMKFTRTFDSATVAGLEKPASLSSLDFTKLRIIDAQSILDGLEKDGKIKPERILQFRAMLTNPELAMTAFKLFLDNSIFPELPDIDKIDVKELNSGLRNILITAKFPEKITDFLVSEICKTFKSDIRFVLSAYSLESLKKSKLRPLGKEILNLQISCIVNSFSKAGLGCPPTIVIDLASFITREFIKLPNAQLSKEMIYSGVSSSIGNQTYRNTIVSFLAAFEYKKGEKSLSIFFPSDYSGVSSTDIGGIFSLLSYFDGKKVRYLFPSFLPKLGDSCNFMTREEGFDYVIYHEFGHAIFDLLEIKTSSNDSIFSKNIPDFEKIKSECPEFINKLIFPKLTMESAEKLEGFLRVDLKKGGDFSFQSHIDHFIGQMQNIYAAFEWSTPKEMLQIAGLLMKNDTIIVNTLSDLDLFADKHLPARWLHQTAETLSQFFPFPDSPPFPLERIPLVNEEDFKSLFYLRGIDYGTYKSGL